MKKIYTLLGLLIAFFCCGLTANAQTIKVNVDDPAHVTARIDQTPKSLVAGENRIEDSSYSGGSIFYVKPVSGYTVSLDGGTPTTDEIQIAINWGNANKTFTITTASLGGGEEEKEIGKFTLIVDDPEFIMYAWKGYSGTYEQDIDASALQAGENEIEFTIGDQDHIAIVTTAIMHSFKVGDEEIEGVAWAKFFRYEFDVNNGDVVTALSKDPNQKDPFATFTFENEGTEDVIRTIYVDGYPVEEWKDGVTVPYGKEIQFNFDTNNYELTSVTLNGEVMERFYTTLTEDAVFHITARKYGNITVNVNVDKAANVNLYTTGWADENARVALTDGDNEVVIPEKGNTLFFDPASGCTILSIHDEHGNEIHRSSTTSFTYRDIHDGTNFFVTTYNPESGDPEPMGHAVVFVDSMPEDAVWKDGKKNEVTFENGYNDYEFSMIAPKQTFTSSDSHVVVIVNDVIQTKGWFSDDRDFTLHSDDVVLIFGNGEPTKHTMSIELEGNVEITVLKHHKALVDDHTSFEMHEGTEIRVKPTNEDEMIYLTTATAAPAEVRGHRAAASNPDIIANADKSWTVKVNENTKNLFATDDIPTGIYDIEATDNTDTRIFNIQGIELKGNVENLPAGLYIVNGKKVLVK